MRPKTVILLLGTAFSVTTAFASGTKNGAETGFPERILACLRSDQLPEAIVAAAAYEQNLLAKYPGPTFEMEVFQSEAEHLSFHTEFNGWTQIPFKELGLPDWLPMAGFNVLLALEGKVEEDKFVVFSVNWGQIEQRTGMSQEGKTELTDRELLLIAEMLAGNFGVPKSQDFEMAGDHRVLAMSIDTPALGPSISLVILPHAKRLYFFMLASSAGNYAENERRLFSTAKTMDFNYKPINGSRIESIRGQFAGQADDPASALACAKALGEAGEYDAAAEDLGRLRLLLSERMPKPLIQGNVAKDPAYGITLTNPDAKRWDLSIQTEGAIRGILIEDKFSVRSEGMMVAVLDMALCFGPQAAKAMQAEEELKQLLIGGGRGGAMSLGEIEEEQFTYLKGKLAYDATVKMNAPGVKARYLYSVQSSYAVVILIMADSNRFDEKVKQFDNIIEAYLQVE